MTLPVKLNLVWAETGGQIDPGDTKYATGWIAEIPSFQNMNYAMSNLDKAKLSYAERDIYPWQDLIRYEVGARVNRNGTIYRCIVTHNDSAGGDPQDPALDTTNSYWVSGAVFSSLPDAYSSLKAQEGVKISEVYARSTSNKWTNNDLTILNELPTIGLMQKNVAYNNLLLSNFRGELVVVDTGSTPNPDGRDLDPNTNAKSSRIYHEGHPPNQSEVPGTIPDALSDGTIYGRLNGGWVKVTSTTASTAPPPPVVGAGAGWYNLEDGQLYIDINDGDSSQWAVANPPRSLQVAAVDVDYNNTSSGLAAVNVKAAIDELSNLVLAQQQQISKLLAALGE